MKFWPWMLASLLLTGCQSPPFPPDSSVSEQDAIGARKLIDDLRSRGTLSADDSKVIKAAAALNPSLLTGAVDRLKQADSNSLPPDPSREILAATRSDLLYRATLQAIDSGIVAPPMALKDDVKAAVLKLSSSDIPYVALPEKLNQDIYKILKDQVFVMNPACERQFTLLVDMRSSKCQDIQWDRSQFNSVLRIEVDGEVICTGTALGNGFVLTAAHCVIDTARRPKARIAPSKIKVLNDKGERVALISSPLVPLRFFDEKCEGNCTDYDYDFSILKVSLDEPSWKPRPAIIKAISSGPRRMTIAGYGKSNYTSAMEGGLLVGPLTIDITAANQSFVWDFDGQALPLTSSFCGGDSGGPIFDGEPLLKGAALNIVGVISHYSPKDNQGCMRSRAYAVNLTQPQLRETLCGFLGASVELCRP
ncbi:trypsin-like serine protease [Pseudomonas fluorescens]|uniref:trypsin-like serine protease n=1 Tax=Pseudomonas fluorescens TaxID=294 RepID=UPI001912783C|nr:trypsin-like serine protease [Pseudomonas fluorescens]